MLDNWRDSLIPLNVLLTKVKIIERKQNYNQAPETFTTSIPNFQEHFLIDYDVFCIWITNYQGT
jgi:hypothetical protein